MGFGANSLIHTSKILRLSEDLPVVVEIIDHPDRLEPLLDKLDAMLKEGMVTREPVDVIAYRHS
jgi:PII-like signaling protein